MSQTWGIVAVALALFLLAVPATTWSPSTAPAPQGSAPRLDFVMPSAGGPINNGTNNSSFSSLGNAVVKFVSWFESTLVTVLLLVIAVLLVGGIVNYLVVGSRRRPWTPPVFAPPVLPARVGPPPPLVFPTTETAPPAPGPSSPEAPLEEFAP